MARIRVYELAKELGLSSAELRDRLQGLGVEVKSASSTIDDVTATTVRDLLVEEAAAGGDGGQAAPTAVEAAEEEQEGIEPIEVAFPVSVRDFAAQLDTDVANVISELLRLGTPMTANHEITLELAQRLGEGWGYRVIAKGRPGPAPEVQPAVQAPAPAPTPAPVGKSVV